MPQKVTSWGVLHFEKLPANLFYTPLAAYSLFFISILSPLDRFLDRLLIQSQALHSFILIYPNLNILNPQN